MADGFERHSIFGKPRGGRGVQRPHLRRGALPQLELQEFGQEVVIAEPGAADIDRHDECVLVIERLKYRLGARFAHQYLWIRAVHRSRIDVLRRNASLLRLRSSTSAADSYIRSAPRILDESLRVRIPAIRKSASRTLPPIPRPLTSIRVAFSGGLMPVAPGDTGLLGAEDRSATLISVTCPGGQSCSPTQGLTRRETIVVRGGRRATGFQLPHASED